MYEGFTCLEEPVRELSALMAARIMSRYGGFLGPSCAVFAAAMPATPYINHPCPKISKSTPLHRVSDPHPFLADPDPGDPGL